MDYCAYGSTEKIVSVIGFSGFCLQEGDESDLITRMAVSSYKKGINYFHLPVSDFSEKMVSSFASAFKEMKLSGSPFYVSVSVTETEPNSVRAKMEQLIKQLGVDKIDFFHCPIFSNLDDWTTLKEGPLFETLKQAKEDGLIDQIILSTEFDGDTISKVLSDSLFDGVTLEYHAGNFVSKETGIVKAAELGLGVAIFNPLGFQNSVLQNEAQFQWLQAETQNPLYDGALHFLLADTSISVRLFEFKTESDIDLAVQCVASIQPPFLEKALAKKRERLIVQQ